ncbi:MAG: DUF4920 domain-containing protein [Bryobacterales bacterium]|nr:DUF4920 domain-containing protein [Bryobacterales bacterium]
MSRFPLLLATVALFAVGSFAATLNLGAPLKIKKTTPIAELLGSPDQFVGKPVQVTGRITEVCQKAGCWMLLVDDESGKAIRIKVNDGEIVFPKDGNGRQALAEGVFTKIERTREQTIAAAKHEAEEQGRPFDPASVTGGSVVFQIQGTGARVMDK